jgi:hypothetical protein
MINEHVWFCKGLLFGKVENINFIMKVSMILIKVSHNSLTDLKWHNVIVYLQKTHKIWQFRS